MIGNDQAKQIANLAKIDINDNLDKITRDLKDFSQLASQLATINTDGVEPMSHPLSMTQRLREDEVTETDNSASFQEIAPQTAPLRAIILRQPWLSNAQQDYLAIITKF